MGEQQKAELVREKTTLITNPCAVEANPFPQFKSYTALRLKRDEIPLISESRVKINSVKHFLEFDNIFFRNLHDSRPLLNLSNRPFSIKKQFVLQLMNLIAQDCEFYRPFVGAFVVRYQQYGVRRQDCKLPANSKPLSLLTLTSRVDPFADERIGEIFVRSVGALHGDGGERLLWAKAYSAFLVAVAEVDEKIDLDGPQ
jgi:hypothetical protein